MGISVTKSLFRVVYLAVVFFQFFFYMKPIPTYTISLIYSVAFGVIGIFWLDRCLRKRRFIVFNIFISFIVVASTIVLIHTIYKLVGLLT